MDEKFSQSKEAIIAMIPKSSDVEFMTKNKQALTELSQMNKQLETLISLEENRKLFNEIMDNFAKSDYVQSLLAINSKKVEKEKEFEKMMKPLKEQLDVINNKVMYFCYSSNLIHFHNRSMKVMQ